MSLRSAGGEGYEADVVVSGLGMLNVPLVPEFSGRDRFRGRSDHSARWDHSDDLAGKAVAVVGTGASAVQLVPAIAPAVGQLTVFSDHRAGSCPRWITST